MLYHAHVADVPAITVDDDAAEPCAQCGMDLVEGCNGRGWLSMPDRSARRCPRAGARVAERMVAESGVPELYARKTLDHLSVSGRGAPRLISARDRCRAWLDAFVPHGVDRTARGLVLAGPPGTGKTHLAAALLLELARRHAIRVLFADFTRVCYEIQATYDAEGSESASESRVLMPLMTAHVLVLDDLGARRPTPFVHDTLYLILNGRLTRRWPTIFTTNHPLDEADAVPGERRLPERGGAPEFEPLVRRVGPTIFSRMFEAVEHPPVSLAGVADYRRLSHG